MTKITKQKLCNSDLINIVNPIFYITFTNSFGVCSIANVKLQIKALRQNGNLKSEQVEIKIHKLTNVDYSNLL